VAYADQQFPATFAAGANGKWHVERIDAVTGDTLAFAPAIEILPGVVPGPVGPAVWSLRGVAGHARYVTRAEADRLREVSPPLGRPESTRAVLIPIRKSAAWWAMAQDERRAVMEESSRHFSVGIRYLPAIARRLYHSRDLGEPFDFLTWFEFAPSEAGAFDELLGKLRAQPEWKYVDREVEVRLSY
jgi:hypothetical protein